MTKFKIISMTTIALAGVAASLMIQRQSQARFRAGEARLQQQSNQLAALTAEHGRLSNLVSRASSAPANDNAAELAKLRREAEALKKQTNDLGRPLARRQDSPPSRTAPSQASHTPEYYEQMRQMAGSKPTEARDLGMAFRAYAEDHQNQSPVSLDQLASYLAKENRSLSGSNQFEIAYHGSLDQLQGLPWGSVAVIREPQPWPGPDGRMLRVYGFLDGHSQMVSSDDNFQSWETQHVIAPPAIRASGQ
jgi:hypothetical protein